MMKHYNQAILLEYIITFFVFFIIALCSHSVFLSQFLGESFIPFSYAGGDSAAQMIPAISFLENALLSGDLFWSWEYGLGGDAYSEFAYYYSTSPFFYLMFFIKCVFGVAGGDFATTQAWRLIGSIIKQLLCMLFMYRLNRQEKRTPIFAAIGAIMYGCSFWYIDNSFAFDFMTDAMLWPPLIVIAYNRYTATSRPLFLIVSVSLAVANSFYFGYMTLLFLILFALVFSIPFSECTVKQKPGNSKHTACKLKTNVVIYFKQIGKLALIALIAIALAAIAFFPSVEAFFAADRVAQLVNYDLLPSKALLSMLPEILFVGYTPSSYMDLQTYAFPLALILVPFISWKNADGRLKKKTILAAAMLVFCLIPVIASLFNGLSFPSNRWLYLVIFAVSYGFPAWMETLLEQRRINTKALICIVTLFLIALITKSMRWDYGNASSGYQFPNFGGSLMLHLILGLLFIVVLALLQRTPIESLKRHAVRGVCFMLFVGSTILVMPFGPLRAINDDCSHPGVEYYDSYDELNESFIGSKETQQLYSQIKKEDDSFYRIYDGETVINPISNNHIVRVENRSWLTGTNGISAYNSMITQSLSQALKIDYAVTSTTISASQYRGLGNRLFLENVWGVGYKINVGADKNTPLYGYELIKLENDQAVWRNKYSCGVDLWYTSVLPYEQWEQLSFGQKDALLLQTAVLDNEQRIALPQYNDFSAQISSTEFIDLASLDISFSECSFEGNAIQGELKASNNASICFELPTIEGCYLFSFSVKNTNNSSWSFNINGTKYHLSENGSRWSYPQDIICVSIPGNAKNVMIDVPEGQYCLYNCSLEIVPYEMLSTWAESANAVNFEDLIINGPSVSGTINANEKGILAINVPYNSGWECTIDCNPVEVVRVNNFFPGVVVEPGEHQIEFTYKNKAFMFGAIVSITTLATLIFVAILNLRKEHHGVKQNCCANIIIS